jgi:hypothetical protein
VLHFFKRFGHKIFSNSLSGLFNLTFICFSPKFYFIHIEVLKFERGERETHHKNYEGERTLLVCQISTIKNDDFGVYESHLTMEVPLRSF